MTIQSAVRAPTPLSTRHGALVGRSAESWLRARLGSSGGAASFEVSSDERFWRLRHVEGEAASMIESRLPVPLTSLEVAHAVMRWAAGEGLGARIVAADGGDVRVSLGATG